MNFRTEIETRKSPWKISHDDKIVMLGSCFTDNIGERLEREGFDVVHNPMGPLYNPASLLYAVFRAVKEPDYSQWDLYQDSAGAWHCLDFASRYAHENRQALIDMLRRDMQALSSHLAEATCLIITLGTSWVYLADRRPVGNCHKFPASFFQRRCLPISEISQCLQTLISYLPSQCKKVIFTVSPIRHIGDGLHENQLSKAMLLIGVEQIIKNGGCQYFPAYEIMMDDLRDYRFYAADMKHLSEVAVDYIYEKFADTYFTPSTKEEARRRLALWKRSNHRNIIEK